MLFNSGSIETNNKVTTSLVFNHFCLQLCLHLGADNQHCSTSVLLEGHHSVL